MEEKGNINRVSVRKHEGKRPFGRPRQKWEDSMVHNS
jgi:hypothetical protein